MSLGECLMIALVAIIVLGPKQLPSVARTIGLWIGKLRNNLQAVENILQNKTSSSDAKPNNVHLISNESQNKSNQ